MSNKLTVDLVVKAVPPNLKNSISQSLVDKINSVGADQYEAELMRNNFLSYSTVLREGKYKLEDYLNAVVFVSHRVSGNTNHDSYFKTFPSRYQNLVSLGKTPKEVANHVSAYSRNQLVNKILAQTLVPVWILNADMHQEALNVQYQIMNDQDVSPKVRVEAANSLLTHLAKPKENAPLINFDMRESSGLDALKQALGELAEQQRDSIQGGMTAKQIADQKIVDVEAK